MNRLQHETSPYLLQHAANPVDWYPWGEEALQKARAEDKPILLSIGYSACHWCHVMEHESFEDPETAAIMNDHYVSIKVDREERPDVDDIYMQATLIFTGGHGGWPMTVFLIPDGKPFHAGTYFPPVPRHGMPSFKQVLMAAADAYHKRREEVEDSANRVANSLQSAGLVVSAQTDSPLTEDILVRAAQKLTARPDRIFGGLHSGQPKFPSPMNLEFLLRFHAEKTAPEILDIVTFTLRKMANGGIYDQIGGGFHRYSVDNKWLVPHFEKMLYDNAQLARVYLHAYQLTNEDFFADITRDILTYVMREMLDDSGGFYSTQDADSEGEEGKFFVWTVEEAEDALAAHLSDADIKLVTEYYSLMPEGNFEGKNIPNIEDPLEDVARWNDKTVDEAQAIIDHARELLFQAREQRIKPGRDEKMLAAWNGMMLAAFAEAARVLGDGVYADVAVDNAEFIMHELADGWRLFRTHKRRGDGTGETKLNGYLEDYANVIDGLLELYQTTFDPRWFDDARSLTDHVIDHFRNTESGGFYDTSDDHEELIARPRSLQDNATPAGNNLMALNLIRLAAYTGEHHYEDIAVEILSGLTAAMQEYPSAFGTALSALHLHIYRPQEVAIVGAVGDDATSTILNTVQGPFRPRVIAALSEDEPGENATPPLLNYRSVKNGQPTVYICQNFVCQTPVNSAGEVAELLG